VKHSSKKTLVKKPRPDFPLFPHRTGYWAKKVRGKFCYFGKTAEDPKGQAALALWLEQKDDLLAGRTPRPKTDGFTLGDLCNHFLTAKNNQLEQGELSPHTFRDYKQTCDKLIGYFGKNRLVDDLRPEDFGNFRQAISKGISIVTVGNYIRSSRVAFKFAYDSGLIDRPMRFGPQFKRPSRKAMRVIRGKQAPKLFEAADIRSMLELAPLQLKAMILLAINCGFGNSDCATLPLRTLDLTTGWIHHPRPKTGIDRKCPLWPETIEALKNVLAKRKEPKNEAHKEQVFITKAGGSFSKDTADNPITKEFAKVIKELKLQQLGRSFYALRHTFRTIADEARDQPACDHIMGHASEHISSHYRERIDDTRLRAVADYVRAWLFAEEVKSNG
jgi:integrase